jgi:small subunit ribosomal protein S17
MATATKVETLDRGRRHLFRGTVVSDKTDRMRVVQVERTMRHAVYEKVMRKRSKFYVHDERNESHTGDFIEIVGTRPLSKLKRWRLVRILKTAPRIASAKGSAQGPGEGEV